MSFHQYIKLYLTCNVYLQMCEGGTVVDLVNGLLLQNKKMKEEHIGYILRELIKVYTRTTVIRKTSN